MAILINQQAINTITFPGGESQVRIELVISNKTAITTLLKSADDIMELLLSVDAIRRINQDTQINLTIPYFPYARQDRVCYPGEALSVKVMADLINSLHCHSVTIIDPHSDVTPALLNRCRVISMSDIIINSKLSEFIKKEKFTLVAPDTGAVKKVSASAKALNTDLLMANKKRDPQTGRITDTQIIGKVENKAYLICDDICDGGSTFIALAKKLKEQGAGEIYLYVTHGIFSKGLSELTHYFKNIFCFHSFLNDESKLNIIKENYYDY